MRLSLISKSSAMALCIPASGSVIALWDVSRERRPISVWLVYSKNASGTMQDRPLACSSSPMGQVQMAPWGWGRFKHKWLHPPLLWWQSLPAKETPPEERWISSWSFFSHHYDQKQSWLTQWPLRDVAKIVNVILKIECFFWYCLQLYAEAKWYMYVR